MSLEQSVFSYNILGYKFQLSSEAGESDVGPELVVDKVREFTDRIRNQNPSLENGEVALLAALAIAKENISLEKEYKVSLDELKESAQDALGLIESVSPTTA